MNFKFSFKKHTTKLEEADFRDLYHRVIFIKLTPQLESFLSEKIEFSDKDNGLLAYGYIDDEAGFSFSVLCAARIDGKKLLRGKYNNKTNIIFRKGFLNHCEYLHLDSFDIDTSDFDNLIATINKIYRCESEDTERMRKFTFFDNSRNKDFPDDIKVFLLNKNLNPEQVWAKCWMITENELFAKLLNEPNHDFGIHAGDIIGFTPTKYEDGILCIYNGRRLEEVEM